MLKWQISEEKAWTALQVGMTQPSSSIHPRRNWLTQGAIGLLLIALVGTIYGMWSTSKPNLGRNEAELLNVIALESKPVAAPRLDEASTQPWLQSILAQEQGLAIKLDREAAPTKIEIERVHTDGDWAIVQVIVAQPALQGSPVAYRQTRFYHRNGNQWQRSAPSATLWGTARSLVTEHFTFQFREKDQPIVAAVAAPIEELYPSLRRDFGLAPADPKQQLRIEVTISAPSSGRSYLTFVDGKLIVPSPALLPVATQLTEADVLTQYIVTALQVHIQATQGFPIKREWSPMLVALRRWQLWRHNASLTAWHDQRATWLYNHSQRSSTVSLHRLIELCQRSQVLEAFVPLGTASFSQWCNRHEREHLPWLIGKPPTGLKDLIVPNGGEPLERAYTQLDWHNYLPLETVIDYAVITYGRDRLPKLLEALGRYDTWQTLIPAVFGVSADKFEWGWQIYLQTRDEPPN